MGHKGKRGGRQGAIGAGASSGARTATRAATRAAGRNTPERFHAAALKRVERAFARSPGSDERTNFVRLSDLRDRLGGSRAQQDAWIHRTRLAKRFSLETAEGGFHSSVTHWDRRAAIREGPGEWNTAASQGFVYIARR